MEENNFVQTDEKTIIKIDWIKDIKKFDKCFILETNIDTDVSYKICQQNPSHKIIDKLYKKYNQNQK